MMNKFTYTIYQGAWSPTPYKPSKLPQDAMAEVWSGQIEALKIEHALEEIFTTFQRVGDIHMPPSGYQGRSLSVGDVIALETSSMRRPIMYAVEPVGFKMLMPHEHPHIVEDLFA